MSEIPAGAMRFNSDSQKLEYWNGSAWFQVHTATPNLASAGDKEPGARGITGGGRPPLEIDTIEYINILPQVMQLILETCLDARTQGLHQWFINSWIMGRWKDASLITNYDTVNY